MPIGKNNKEFCKSIIEEINLAEILNAVLSHRPLDRVVSWIATNLKPEQVFDQAQLNAWAERNGFMREE